MPTHVHRAKKVLGAARRWKGKKKRAACMGKCMLKLQRWHNKSVKVASQLPPASASFMWLVLVQQGSAIIMLQMQRRHGGGSHLAATTCRKEDCSDCASAPLKAPFPCAGGRRAPNRYVLVYYIISVLACEFGHARRYWHKKQ